MDERRQDPWRERLSEYVDGELDPAERAALEAHLMSCEPCRVLATDLRALAGRARSLGGRAPGRDLWPSIRAELVGRAPVRRIPGWPMALAAGLLLGLGLGLALERSRGPREGERASGGAYLLLLHEPNGFEGGETPEEQAAIVERYGRWARGLGARFLAGDELAQGGWELRSDAGEVRIEEATAGHQADLIGGYFLVQAASRDEALALARTCPHLERGGWIEVRRIQE